MNGVCVESSCSVIGDYMSKYVVVCITESNIDPSSFDLSFILFFLYRSFVGLRELFWLSSFLTLLYRVQIILKLLIIGTKLVQFKMSHFQ